MNKTLRYFLYLICGVQTFFAISFFLRLPFAVDLWPFEGTTPLSFIFLSSIFAAAAASTFWAVASGNHGALAGIGLDYVFILVPFAIHAFQLGANQDNSSLTTFAVVCVLGALFGMGLLLGSIRIPIEASPPMPTLVRWSFVAFIIALLIVALSMIFKEPNVIPWAVTPDLSVLIGWIFFGAAAYFAYSLLRPSWFNSAGQLVGFLVYDIVLIEPFLSRLPTVASEHRLSLIIYTTVVIYSGLLATYYLFINNATRIWKRPQLVPQS
ncbi:MAG: hypothetical protein L0154_15425 [Chloroflexi bacterium]|nr:hypothetical protein [Chloroflexota bacterium]